MCKSIILMRFAAQHVATLASLHRYHKPDYVYPKSRIDTCWEKVLLNQCTFIPDLQTTLSNTYLLQSMMVSRDPYLMIATRLTFFISPSWLCYVSPVSYR